MPPALAIRPYSAYKSVCHEAGGLTLVARVNTVAFEGIEVLDIDVQVQLSGGIVAFNVVGLPDKSILKKRRRSPRLWSSALSDKVW